MQPRDPSLQNRRRQAQTTVGQVTIGFIMAITYSNFLTQVRNYTEVDSNVLTDSIIRSIYKKYRIRYCWSCGL